MNTLLEQIEQSLTLPPVAGSAVVMAAVRGILETLSDADTPRVPKTEWFGTGPGQWDAWWIEESCGRVNICRSVTLLTDTMEGMIAWTDMQGKWRYIDVLQIKTCLPVAREGFPSAVGWQVVGE